MNKTEACAALLARLREQESDPDQRASLFAELRTATGRMENRGEVGPELALRLGARMLALLVTEDDSPDQRTLEQWLGTPVGPLRETRPATDAEVVGWLGPVRDVTSL